MASRLRLPARRLRPRGNGNGGLPATRRAPSGPDGGANGDGSNGGGPPRPTATLPPPSGPPRRRPKLKKLRLALVIFGLAILAFVSWIFGIMMAVASDLPQLEDQAQFAHAENSVVYDVNGNRIATLTNNRRSRSSS
jgi:penicillin-binding protein 1A